MGTGHQKGSMKRACHGTTKAGNPCSRPPMRDGDYCIGHADKETKEAKGFGGPQQGSGRPRKPRTVDLMREWVEDHPEAFGVIKEALSAKRAIVVGNTKDAYVEYVPDWPTRIVAFKELMDRAYGKSKTFAEHTIITDDVLAQAMRTMEEEFARLDRSDSQPGDDSALLGDEAAA